MCYWLRAAQINDQRQREAVSLHPEFSEGSQCGARLLRGLPLREAGVLGRFPGKSRRLRLSLRGLGCGDAILPSCNGFLRQDSSKIATTALALPA